MVSAAFENTRSKTLSNLNAGAKSIDIHYVNNELILNGDRYILPSKNFMAFQEEDKKKYEEYKIIVDDIRKK